MKPGTLVRYRGQELKGVSQSCYERRNESKGLASSLHIRVSLVMGVRRPSVRVMMRLRIERDLKEIAEDKKIRALVAY